MALEVLAFVKHDCPVCDQVLPALDAAGARAGLAVLARGHRRAGRAAGALARAGDRRRPDAVGPLRPRRRACRPAARRRRRARPGRGARARPHGGARRARRAARCASTACPRCGRAARSMTRDPEIAARLAARRARAERPDRRARALDRRARRPVRGAARARPDRRAASCPADARARRRDARAHVAPSSGPRGRGAALRRPRHRREGSDQRGDGRLRGPRAADRARRARGRVP